MIRRLLRSTAVVGQMTLISRVLGFLRDMVIAQGFGAGLAADAFFVAFKIPNFLRRLFAEGAFSQAFVPVLTEYKVQRTPAEVRALVAQAAGTLGGILLPLILLGMLASPLVIALFAPGFIGSGEKFELASAMFRLTFPYLLFISLTALAGSVLNTFGRFAVPAFTPVLLNVSLITAVLALAPRLEVPAMALAWGVFAAGLAQLLFQLPWLHRLGMLARPRWGAGEPGVRRIARLMVPALFGVSVVQINLLIDTLIASFLATGSVSWLYYSDRLVELPLALFGIAVATVILPVLSEHATRGGQGPFSRLLDGALRAVTLAALPCVVGLGLLAGPILCTLFQYGEMTAHDVHMAARSLVAYAVGLIGFVYVKVLAPGFYARQDTRTPVLIGLVALGVNATLNVALVFPLQHAGLALATSLAALVNGALLLRTLRRQGVYRPEAGWPLFLLRLLAACAAMALLLQRCVPPMAQWLAWSALERAGALALWVVAGALCYGLGLWLTGLRVPRLRA